MIYSQDIPFRSETLVIAVFFVTSIIFFLYLVLSRFCLSAAVSAFKLFPCHFVKSMDMPEIMWPLNEMLDASQSWILLGMLQPVGCCVSKL